MESPPAEEKPAASWWQVAQEHVVKASIYLGVVVQTVLSYQRASHNTTASFVLNAVICALFSVGVVKEIRTIWKRRYLPPGLHGFPVIGEVPWLVASKGDFGAYFSNKLRNYGSVFYSVTPFPMISLGDEESISWLFLNERKSKVENQWPPNISALLGPESVANKIGAQHKALRRLVQPWFAPTFVHHYLQVMDETTVSDMKKWTKDFQSSDVFKTYALRLFFASSFGKVDEKILSDFHKDYSEWIGGFWTLTGSLRIHGSAFDKAMKARDRILASIERLVEDFYRVNPEGSERAENTIMGRLIYGRDADGNKLSRDEIKDNLLTIIFAGHDTTFGSLSSVLHHLSRNQDAWDALFKEVRAFQEPLDADELKNAPVLNAVMSESWRADPPVLAGYRKAQDDVSYKGYRFPKGTVFNYNNFLVLSDERRYKDGWTAFNFRRFLPKGHPLYDPHWDAGVDPHQGRADYPVFGLGSHACLGRSFALLEMRVFLTRLVQNYTIRVKNDTKVWLPVNTWKVDFKLTERE